MAFRIIQWSFLLGLAFYSLFIGAAQVSLSDLWQMDGEQLQCCKAAFRASAAFSW